MKNASEWIEECLESILKQSFNSWELIVVDDASTDNSRAIAQSFSEHDNRIAILRNNGVGIVSALDQAFKNSQGEFVHRMDADDLMPPNKLQNLYNALAGRKEVVVTGEVAYFSKGTVSQGYLDYQNWLNSIQNYKHEIYRECAVASPNWMVHRSCFELHINMAGLNYPEDYDMLLRWYEKGYKIERISTLTHYWREHAQRTSRNSEIYQQASFFKLKMGYFVKLELDVNEKIQVIGAGEKGKLVAEVLRKLAIDFDWFDMNEGRVDSVPGLKSIVEIRPGVKSILTNWPKNKKIQGEILLYLGQLDLLQGKNLWVV